MCIPIPNQVRLVRSARNLKSRIRNGSEGARIPSFLEQEKGDFFLLWGGYHFQQVLLVFWPNTETASNALTVCGIQRGEYNLAKSIYCRLLYIFICILHPKKMYITALYCVIEAPIHFLQRAGRMIIPQQLSAKIDAKQKIRKELHQSAPFNHRVDIVRGGGSYRFIHLYSKGGGN